MKKILFFFFLALGITNVKGQILRERNILLPDSSVLSYLTNQDKLSGLYTIKKANTDIARGNYVDGKRVGNWYFFNKDKSLFLRYNYDSKKLLFVDDKTLAMANVAIKSTDPEVSTKASVTVPIFSLEQYIILAAKAATVAIPGEDQLKLGSKSISLVASVSKDGTAQYFAKYQIKGKDYERKLSLGKDVLIEWMPAVFNGTAYDSEFTIATPINFNSKDPGMHRRFNWF